MADIRITVDAKDALSFLDRTSKQMPYAMAIAINRTAEDSNAAIRKSMLKNLTIRDKRLLDSAAPSILSGRNRATKTNLRAILETKNRGRILNPLEEGDPHTTDRLGRQVAIPGTGPGEPRADKMATIPRSLYPVNVGLVPRLDPKGTLYYALGRGSKAKKLTPTVVHAAGKTLLIGKRQTFQIGSIIFQRRGRKNVVALWFLRPSVPRPKALHFADTVEATVDARWDINMTGAFEAAVRTAR